MEPNEEDSGHRQLCTPIGNCEIMVKEVFRGLGEPCELNLLRLTDFRIDPCQGCYHCLFKDGQCVIEDEWRIECPPPPTRLKT